MSTTPPDIPPDDPLARAEAALRDLPVPDGPSEESLARALAVARAAEGRSGIVPLSRRRVVMMSLKIAAAVVVAGGLFYLAPRPRTATAFEVVAQKLHDAHTLVYKTTETIEGMPELAGPIRMTHYYRTPGLARMETGMAGAAAVSILDGSRRRMVLLDPDKKSAIVMENTDPPDNFATRAFDEIRNLPVKEARAIGRERIGDVEAEGYHVTKDSGMTFDAWVDPKSKLPIRIDMKLRVSGKEVRATVSNFQLDPPLDDSLFSSDPPAGYAVQTMNGAILFDKPEAAVVRVLRAYTGVSDGAFPAKLDDVNAYKALEKLFPKDREKKSMTQIDPKTMELAMSLGRVMGLRLVVKEYGYKPDGVKLGDAGKIVFWYKPEGSDKYRAVYGDLHVGDVAADDLPEKPGR